MGAGEQISIQREDFDLAKEYAKLRVKIGNEVGAIVTFTGTVREQVFSENTEERTSTLRLEHYPGMTEKQLKKIEEEALSRWPLEGVLIIHRYGRLKPGDQIVLVATTSKHREAALESCHFLIDWLKTKALFWKMECGESGESWVQASDEDEDAASRWDGNAP